MGINDENVQFVTYSPIYALREDDYDIFGVSLR